MTALDPAKRCTLVAVLLALRGGKSMPQRALASAAGISEPTVARMRPSLVAAGIIYVREEPSDREAPVTWHALTPRGEQAADHAAAMRALFLGGPLRAA
ncbi:MAG TPA: hypothetical protein VNX21_00415 [Candidatus Thermoplasmatota archaeon]|nr:hypothetical protein [Candidatus Thermoplasmatota archaeon]